MRTATRDTGSAGQASLPAQAGDAPARRGGSWAGVCGAGSVSPTVSPAAVRQPLTHRMAGADVPVTPGISRRYGCFTAPADAALLRTADRKAALLVELATHGWIDEAECLQALDSHDTGAITQSREIARILNGAITKIELATEERLATAKGLLADIGFNPDKSGMGWWEAQFSLDEDPFGLTSAYFDDMGRDIPPRLVSEYGDVAVLPLDLDITKTENKLLAQFILAICRASQHGTTLDMMQDHTAQYFVLGEYAELDDAQIQLLANAPIDDTEQGFKHIAFNVLELGFHNECDSDEIENIQTMLRAVASSTALMKSLGCDADRPISSFCAEIAASQDAPEWLKSLASIVDSSFDSSVAAEVHIEHGGDLVYDFMRPIALGLDCEEDFLECYHQTGMMGDEGAFIAIPLTADCPGVLANITILEWALQFIHNKLEPI